ncbi:MAG: ribosome maturation factor RimP [Clostridiales bacterium]|nr:ribosome maturation factor RimP [Clostridiales bacterium]
MAEKKKTNVAQRVKELVKDAVEECGCTLWDVEFVKEGADRNLIIYIDKPGGVSLTDCEMVNDAVEPIIDKEDPIEESYFLEISSPGIERELKTPEQIKAFAGSKVVIKLFASENGKKNFTGTLLPYDEEENKVSIEENGVKTEFARKACAQIKTVFDF